jgi:hypothetical protein
LLFSNWEQRPDGEVRSVDVDGWQQYRVTLPAGATAVTMAESTGWLELTEERSPDGEWWVRYGRSGPVPAEEDERDRFPGEKYQVQLRVGRVGSNQSWSVVDEWRNYGLGFDWPTPLHWSADGRALYYTNYPSVDGCVVFVSGTDLWRFDLETGTNTQLLPFTSLSLALSPDGSMVAYVKNEREGPDQLVLHSLANGVEQTVDVVWEPEDQIGNLIWSADGNQLLMVIAHQACIVHFWDHSVVLIDVHALTSRAMIAEDERQFTVEEWPAGEFARLLDRDGQGWLLNVASGELTAAE